MPRNMGRKYRDKATTLGFFILREEYGKMHSHVVLIRLGSVFYTLLGPQLLHKRYLSAAKSPRRAI